MAPTTSTPTTSTPTTSTPTTSTPTTAATTTGQGPATSARPARGPRSWFATVRDALRTGPTDRGLSGTIPGYPASRSAATLFLPYE